MCQQSICASQQQVLRAAVALRAGGAQDDRPLASLLNKKNSKGMRDLDPSRAKEVTHNGITNSMILVMRTYFVYILASRSRTLYVGVTNDLARRVDEHQQGLTAGFTSKYRVTRLVYFEQFVDIRDAIAREKELKGWRRSRKVRLIEESNVTWDDLSSHLFL